MPPLVCRSRPQSFQSIQVLRADILQTAYDLAENGDSVCVLCMAGTSKPGGGIESGKGAQEENLYRRSNIARFTFLKREELYPIPRTGCLHSMNVAIFRGPEEYGYPFISPRAVDVISCAATLKPKLTPMRQYENSSTREVMRSKISPDPGCCL